MKRTVIAGMFLTASVFAACNSDSSSENKKDSTASTLTPDTSKTLAAVKYTCTMHPEVISDTPGKCPKCEMDLVAMNDASMQK